MHLSVCAETVFTDHDITSRLEAISRHGIKRFELWGLGSYDLEVLKRLVHEDGYQLVAHA